MSEARYNFYLDNMDLEEAPSIPKYLLNNVTAMIGLPFLDLSLFLELNNHFKRTMNEILFSHLTLNDPSLPLLSCNRATVKKQIQYKPKNRVMKLVRDSKVYKLVLKSMSSKIIDIESKQILFRNDLV